MGHIGAVEPNEARWTISAASVLPGVSACGDWSHLSLFNVTTLPLITGCNQLSVCWRCSPPVGRRAEASMSRPLHELEPSSTLDEKIINIISPCYSVLFSSHGSYLCWAAHALFLPPTSVVTFSSLCCCSQTDRAVQLLLETSADNPSYYCDSLKACLVTTITSSGPSQSTIKLVATNMIANGKLAGIVCLIAVSSLLCSYFNEHEQHSPCGCLQPWMILKMSLNNSSPL